VRVAIGVILLLSALPSVGDEVELQLSAPGTVTKRLQAGEVPAREREQIIHALFEQAGCNVNLEKVDRHSSNVICSLPGKTTATIVVGAHYDFAGEGQGIVDDWSGVSLLVSLFQTLKAARPEHSYQFIAFAAEEKGLAGSSRYVKELSPEQRAGIRAFINLECLGLAMPKIWVQRSTPMLVQRWAETASAAHIPMSGVNVQELADDDTHPFLSKDIPVISIHSVTQETFSILHSKRDTIAAIHPEQYYDSYRVLALYLTYLDGELRK
jgi:putative aminopeptidase FrvX